MSWNCNTFSYTHNPLEDSPPIVRNTNRMEDTTPSLMEELHKVRDQMLAASNSISKPYHMPCRDPLQYHTYPSPPYSPSYHEPYISPPLSSYPSFTYEPSPPPSRAYRETTTPPLPYSTPYRSPSPPPKPTTRKSNALDAFFDYPTMDEHTKELKRLYAINRDRSLELHRKKTACGLSKQLEEELEELGEHLNAFYMHVLWKRTEGEEGAPWPYDPKSEESEQQVPQIQEDTLSSISDTSPLLEEADLPLTTILASEDDSEIDEEIVVESPHKLVAENAHFNTSNSSCVVDDVLCTASIYDDHAYFPNDSNMNDAAPIDQLTCSCDDHIICMDCIDQKYHLLAEFREHALHDAKIAITDEHEYLEVSASIRHPSVDESKNTQSIGISAMHDLHDVEIHPPLSPTPQNS